MSSRIHKKDPHISVEVCVRVTYLPGERTERCLWQEERGERVAAVDKIEDKRKPDDFIGHRNRGPGIDNYVKRKTSLPK